MCILNDDVIFVYRLFSIEKKANNINHTIHLSADHNVIKTLYRKRYKHLRVAQYLKSHLLPQLYCVEYIILRQLIFLSLVIDCIILLLLFGLVFHYI